MPIAEHNGLVLDFFTDPSEASQVGLLALYAFHVYPYIKHMMPDTLAAREAWTKATLVALNDPEHTITLKVTDPAKDNRIVAHGRWVRPKSPGETEQPGHEESRWEGFVEGCEGTNGQEMAVTMFGSYEKHRELLMGDKPHYYMELLATDPSYQRRGLAGMILKYGTDLADAANVPCYVDASPQGKALYEKCEWEFTHEENLGAYDMIYCFGIRPPQQKV